MRQTIVVVVVSEPVDCRAAVQPPIQGLTTAELLASSPRPEALRAILASEERRGRLERDRERWRLVRDAFPADLLAAMAALDQVGRGRFR